MCCVTYYLPVSVGKAVLAHLSANLYVDKVIYAHQWVLWLDLRPLIVSSRYIISNISCIYDVCCSGAALGNIWAVVTSLPWYLHCFVRLWLKLDLNELLAIVMELWWRQNQTCGLNPTALMVIVVRLKLVVRTCSKSKYGYKTKMQVQIHKN